MRNVKNSLLVLAACIACSSSAMNYDEIVATFGNPREMAAESAEANERAEKEFYEKAPSMSVEELKQCLKRADQALRELEMRRVQAMQDVQNSMLRGRSYAAAKRRLHIIERKLRHVQNLKNFIEDLLVKKGASIEPNVEVNGAVESAGSDFWRTLAIAIMSCLTGFVFAMFYFRRRKL